jgi:hypothetical protein
MPDAPKKMPAGDPTGISYSDMEIRSYSAFVQPLILEAPPSTNLFKVPSTSKSLGALNEHVPPSGEGSPHTMSPTPSTVAKAFFTEDAQPPQVMPGSLSETV